MIQKYKIMKPYLLVIVAIVLSFWYLGMFNESFVETDNKTYLCRHEVKELYQKGVIGIPDYSRQYFSTEPTSYFLKRSFIPFVYKRDTVKHSKLGYFSERIR